MAKRSRMAWARAAGGSEYRTAADESVMDAPKPDMVWNVRLGSTTTVGTDARPDVNATVPASASFWAPSGW
ncbi:hypothetical protein GCM10029964_072460 [Kibdelosporangium lantanae]